LSKDSRWLAAGAGDNTVYVWDLAASSPALTCRNLIGHARSNHPFENKIYDLAVSSDGRWLASASGDKTARLWDLGFPAHRSSLELRGHAGYVRKVCFSPDNKWLITASNDGTARRWDLQRDDPTQGVTVLSASAQPLDVLAVSNDSKRLVTAGVDGIARLWDLNAPDPNQSVVKLESHKGLVGTAEFSSDGRWLATGGFDPSGVYGGDPVPRLWDLRAQNPSKAVAVTPDRGAAVTCMAFSPDGKWFATGTALLRLDRDNPLEIQSLLIDGRRPVDQLSFSSDSRWLVTGLRFDGSRARLWQLKTSSPIPPIDVAFRDLGSGINDLGISPDRKWIAAATGKFVQLWNLAKGDASSGTVVLGGHKSHNLHVIFTSNARWLVTWGAEDFTVEKDKSLRLWPLQATDLLNDVSRRAGRGLSQEERRDYIRESN
jgi:WD40 repeat protein